MANHKIDITKNGKTTLATAGKYCDRNVDVNVNVPSLDTTDATATAKNIDYEQTAYVNGVKITGTNHRREYTGEIVSTVVGTTAYVVLLQDELLAEIRTLDTLFIRVECDIEPTAYTIVKNWASNVPMEVIPVLVNNDNRQLTYRYNANAEKDTSYVSQPVYSDNITSVGQLHITEDGELWFYSRSSTNYAIRPCNYKVIVEW